jgi:tRNA 2-thiouridine synthesizing protein A
MDGGGAFLHHDAVPDTLDLRGVRCPLSWARAKVQLESRRRGDEVHLVVDDPQAARDIPRAAEAAGHHVIDITNTGEGVWKITLEV